MVPGLKEPKIVPSYNPEGLDITQTYKWLGWAKEKEPTKVIDLSKIAATGDMSFVAVFEDEPSSVYAEKNILDKKYLYLEYNSSEGGYRIGASEDYKLTGKITLPVMIEGENGLYPIVGIGTNRRTFANPSTVTYND